jgi:hypothetical protein
MTVETFQSEVWHVFGVMLGLSYLYSGVLIARAFRKQLKEKV